MSYRIVEMYRMQLKMLEQIEAELEETHREFVTSQSEPMLVETEANLKEAVIRGMKNMEHSITCQVKDCTIEGCFEMKTVTDHMRKCKSKDKSCDICKTVQSYLYEHANGCTVEGCKVVMCLNIRGKLAARKEAAVNGAPSSIVASTPTVSK